MAQLSEDLIELLAVTDIASHDELPAVSQHLCGRVARGQIRYCRAGLLQQLLLQARCQPECAKAPQGQHRCAKQGAIAWLHGAGGVRGGQGALILARVRRMRRQRLQTSPRLLSTERNCESLGSSKASMGRRSSGWQCPAKLIAALMGMVLVESFNRAASSG